MRYIFMAGLILLGLLTSILIDQPAGAAAGINQQMNYQARLLNSNGAVVPDGTYNMEFKIYQDGHGCVSTGTSPCGGTLLWTETRTTTNRVTVTNGYFSVQLGSVNPFGTSVNWNQDALWLSINIGGTAVSPSWDGEMLAFKRLAATPYALNSNQLGGLDWSKFVQVAPSAAQIDSSTLSTLFLNKTGASGNILQLQKNGTNVAVINNAGSILSSAFDTITTGSLSFGTSTANAITIGNSTNNSAVTINSGTGAINIGTGAQARAINIGTGAAAQTLTLGSTNASTATTIRGGAMSLITNNTGVNILGSGTNGAGGRLYFGDVPNVAIGESGLTDTDSLAFHGATGFNFTSGYGTEALRFSIDSFGDIRVGQSDTTGALFVLDTKTNAGDPVGSNGAMYYNSNTSKIRCYEGSVWRDCDIHGRVFAQLRRAAVQSVPNNTDTLISYDTQDYLPFGGHSTGTNPSRFTPSVAGRYTVTAKAGYATNATGRRAVRINKNGTAIDGGFASIMASPTGTTGVTVTVTAAMNGTTDYFSVEALHTSGGALDLSGTGDANSSLIVTYSGP